VPALLHKDTGAIASARNNRRAIIGSFKFSFLEHPGESVESTWANLGSGRGSCHEGVDIVSVCNYELVLGFIGFLDLEKLFWRRECLRILKS